MIAEEADDCEPEGFFDCGDPTLAAYFFAPLVTGGLGAAVGVGIDALIKKDTNLFLRTGGARVRLAPRWDRVSGLSWCRYGGSHMKDDTPQRDKLNATSVQLDEVFLMRKGVMWSRLASSGTHAFGWECRLSRAMR